MSRPRSCLCVAIGAALAVACTGSPLRPGADASATGGAGEGGAPGTGGAGPGPVLADEATVPGVAPLRRLTILEYTNTLRDLLGVTLPAERLGAQPDQDSGESGFTRGASITAGADALTFLRGAEQAGAAAVKRLAALLPCAPVPAAEPEQEACAGRFIAQFGRRAFRRPLVDSEAEPLRALYRIQRTPEAGATFEEAIGDLVTAMLQSPQFLYHWELGPNAPLHDGPLVRFGPYELASRLSYLFWASMPDDELMAAAEADRLSTPDQIAAQARRLLADDRARDGVRDFHRQWAELGGVEELPKDATFTAWGPEVARAVSEESLAFAGSVFFGPRATGTLEALLTSPASFVDARLAALYGVPAPMGPAAGLQPVTLDPAQRAGLFTRAAFAAIKSDSSETNPVLRGIAILDRILCVPLEIPADINVPPVPDPPPNQTTRQRFEAHGALACAVACHSIIDPIGFAFEHYDAVGAYRTMERGSPVDSRAAFTLKSGASFQYQDAVELMGLLAKDDGVRQCMTTQWLRYALRRRELPTEAPSLKAAAGVFRGAGYDLRELMVALTRTRTFTHRTLSAGEGTP